MVLVLEDDVTLMDLQVDNTNNIKMNDRKENGDIRRLYEERKTTRR